MGWTGAALARLQVDRLASPPGQPCRYLDKLTFIPMRYSIRSLIFATAVVATIVAYLNRPTPIENVHDILRRDISDAQKLEELKPYAALGDQEDDINSRLMAAPDGYRCGFTHDLWSYNCGLQVTYLNGRLVSLGYNIDDGTGYHDLASSP